MRNVAAVSAPSHPRQKDVSTMREQVDRKDRVAVAGNWAAHRMKGRRTEVDFKGGNWIGNFDCDPENFGIPCTTPAIDLRVDYLERRIQTVDLQIGDFMARQEQCPLTTRLHDLEAKMKTLSKSHDNFTKTQREHCTFAKRFEDLEANMETLAKSYKLMKSRQEQEQLKLRVALEEFRDARSQLHSQQKRDIPMTRCEMEKPKRTTSAPAVNKKHAMQGSEGHSLRRLASSSDSFRQEAHQRSEVTLADTTMIPAREGVFDCIGLDISQIGPASHHHLDWHGRVAGFENGNHVSLKEEAFQQETQLKVNAESESWARVALLENLHDSERFISNLVPSLQCRVVDFERLRRFACFWTSMTKMVMHDPQSVKQTFLDMISEIRQDPSKAGCCAALAGEGMVAPAPQNARVVPVAFGAVTVNHAPKEQRESRIPALPNSSSYSRERQELDNPVPHFALDVPPLPWQREQLAIRFCDAPWPPPPGFREELIDCIRSLGGMQIDNLTVFLCQGRVKAVLRGAKEHPQDLNYVASLCMRSKDKLTVQGYRATEVTLEAEDLKLNPSPTEVIVTFSPQYDFGIASRGNGRVDEVERGSQADQQGVKVGWRIRAVGATKCEDFRCIEDKRNRMHENCYPFQVTFETAGETDERFAQPPAPKAPIAVQPVTDMQDDSGDSEDGFKSMRTQARQALRTANASSLQTPSHVQDDSEDSEDGLKSMRKQTRQALRTANASSLQTPNHVQDDSEDSEDGLKSMRKQTRQVLRTASASSLQTPNHVQEHQKPLVGLLASEVFASEDGPERASEYSGFEESFGNH